MPDPKRLESSPTPEAADRDSRAEALLVDGLDCYFSGRYEEAIHLWTRVLFLDRSHARARAYIDRARTALSERHRRAEEMLSRSSELMAHGNTDEARDLLTRAVVASGDDEHAAELRLRLERLERLRATPTGLPEAAAIEDAVPVVVPRPWTARGIWLSTAAGVALVMLVLAGRAVVQEWYVARASAPALAADDRGAALSVPNGPEVAMIRARALYASGRLAEALRALERVRTTSVEREAADRLRAEIQQTLMASRRGVLPESLE